MIEWKKGTPPPKCDGRKYLLKFNMGTICMGEYRYGRYREPQQDVLAWRCECCGSFATPKEWAVIE